MQDSEFNDQVDKIFEQLEDELDALDEVLDASIFDAMDIDSSSGILTISFGTTSAIVLSRQIASHEIWVAAKSGGFHLAHKADASERDTWFCGASGENLAELLTRVFTEQLGSPVSLLPSAAPFE